MDDSRRSRVGDQADDNAAKGRAAEEHVAAPAMPSQSSEVGSERPARAAGKTDGRFIGQAMKSLFESSDVSIRRDDETRVMSRAQDAIADLERRRGIVITADSGAAAPVPSTPAPSRRPGPRVDVVLWVVLAVGLFAIAGWMLMYGL
jgi:hypothetical protein